MIHTMLHIAIAYPREYRAKFSINRDNKILFFYAGVKSILFNKRSFDEKRMKHDRRTNLKTEVKKRQLLNVNHMHWFRSRDNALWTRNQKVFERAKTELTMKKKNENSKKKKNKKTKEKEYEKRYVCYGLSTS